MNGLKWRIEWGRGGKRMDAADMTRGQRARKPLSLASTVLLARQAPGFETNG
jgi:hypothetical protein